MPLTDNRRMMTWHNHRRLLARSVSKTHQAWQDVLSWWYPTGIYNTPSFWMERSTWRTHPSRAENQRLRGKKTKHRRFELLSKADVDRIWMDDVCGGVLNSGETKERKSLRNKTAALPAERTWERLLRRRSALSHSRIQIHDHVCLAEAFFLVSGFTCRKFSLQLHLFTEIWLLQLSSD